MLKLNRTYANFFFSEELKASLAPKNFGLANRMGGSSVDGIYDIYKGKFKNQAIQKFKSVYKRLEKFKDPFRKYDSTMIIPGTTIITNKDECLYCV